METYEPFGEHADEEMEPQDEQFADDEGDEEYSAERPRWKRVLKRVGIGLGVTVIVLVALGFALFQWGGMWGSADPTMQARFDTMVASGQARPVQARFVIPIPGCICHSKDPVQTAQHRAYRMSECGSCHSGGGPASQPSM